MPLRHDLVLFDLDGTLSDPLVGIGRSINYALVYFGHAPLELSELATYVGPPLDETFKSITGITAADQVNALVAKYRERYAEVGYSENVLYPGVPEAIARLTEANIPLAVCTSKRVDFAEQILEMFGLRSHFRFVNGGEIGIHKWQQIEALLTDGLVSSATVMAGDRAVDMVAAHRNGLYAAGVLWGYGSHAELAGESPKYLFGSPPELSGLLGANPSMSNVGSLRGVKR